VDGGGKVTGKGQRGKDSGDHGSCWERAAGGGEKEKKCCFGEGVEGEGI